MKKILCAATVLLSFHAYAGEAKKSLSADTVNINLKYLSGMQKEDAEIADGLLNEFAEKYPAIKIIRKMPLSDSENAEENTSISDADIVFSDQITALEYALSGKVVSASIALGDDFLKKFHPAALQTGKFNRIQYMVPAYFGGGLFLVINKTLVPQAPDTWEELMAEGTKLKSEGRIEYILGAEFSEPMITLPFLSCFGASFVDEPSSTEASPQLNSPGAREWCKFISALVDNGSANAEISTHRAAKMFSEGKIPFLFYCRVFDSDFSIQPDGDIAYAPIPPVNGKNPSPMCFGAGYMITSLGAADAKKMEAIKTFIDFMTCKDSQLRMIGKSMLLPANLSALDDEKIMKNEKLRAERIQLDSSFSLAMTERTETIYQAVRAITARMFAGEISPDDAAGKMQQRAENNIKKMKSKRNR